MELIQNWLKNYDWNSMANVDYSVYKQFIQHDPESINLEQARKGNLNVDDIKHIIFKYYRKHGFPYYQFTTSQKNNIMRKLRQYEYKKLLNGDSIRQTMHGLALAWSYFPHSWEIRCNNCLSPMDVYNDDKLFYKFIDKFIQLSGINSTSNRPLTPANFRKVIKIMTGVQSVSNFRPTAAGCIYEHFSGNGVVWDMSAGFGGRLIGALSSNKVKHYIGTDPSTKTFNGLVQIKKDFEWINKKIDIYKERSEDFYPNTEINLCFTSPPYFDTEKYSLESSQSYIKYPSIQEWKTQFLEKTICTCYSVLSRGGKMILNVGNTKRYPTLEEDTVKLSKKCGFKLIRTLKYLMSNINKRDFKFEPIFVFEK